MTTPSTNTTLAVPLGALREADSGMRVEETGSTRMARDTMSFVKTIAGSLFGVLFFLSVVALLVFLVRKYIKRRRDQGFPTCMWFRAQRPQDPRALQRPPVAAISSSDMLMRQHTTVFGPFHQTDGAPRSSGMHMGLWNLNDGGDEDDDSRPPPYSFLDPALRNARSPTPFSPPPSPPLPRHPAEMSSGSPSPTQATTTPQMNTFGSQAGPPMISVLHVGRGTDGVAGRNVWDTPSGARGLEVSLGARPADSNTAGRGSDASGVRFAFPSDPPPPFSAVAGTPTPATSPPFSRATTPTVRPTSPVSTAPTSPASPSHAGATPGSPSSPPRSPGAQRSPSPDANPATGPTLQLRHLADTNEITVTFETPVIPPAQQHVLECPHTHMLDEEDSAEALQREGSAVDGPPSTPVTQSAPHSSAPSSTPSSTPSSAPIPSSPPGHARLGIAPTSVLNSSSDPISPGGPQYTPLTTTGTSSSMPVNSFPVVPSLLELSFPQSSHGSGPSSVPMRQQGVQSLSDCNPSPGGAMGFNAPTIPPAPPLPPQSVLGIGIVPGTTTTTTPPPITGDLPPPPPYLPRGVPPPPYEPSPPDHS